AGRAGVRRPRECSSRRSEVGRAAGPPRRSQERRSSCL
ncbi:MAG: hypothetical protein AVDCRST_MAG01-01-5029, partial [uncultured Rubrobacteraceae bacterium]